MAWMPSHHKIDNSRLKRPGGSGTGGAPTAAAERHRFRTTAGHTFVWLCICILLVSEGAPTRRLPSTSPSLAGWLRGCGERGTRAAVSITPSGLAESPSRPSRESLKTPSRAESRVALNKTESLNIGSCYNQAVYGNNFRSTKLGVRVSTVYMAF